MTTASMTPRVTTLVATTASGRMVVEGPAPALRALAGRRGSSTPSAQRTGRRPGDKPGEDEERVVLDLERLQEHREDKRVDRHQRQRVNEASRPPRGSNHGGSSPLTARGGRCSGTGPGNGQRRRRGSRRSKSRRGAMRWPRRHRGSGGRLPSLGQDHGEGHRRYVERIGPGGELWLRTKPFSAPPGHELRECLRTFAHIVDRLGLGRSRPGPGRRLRPGLAERVPGTLRLLGDGRRRLGGHGQDRPRAHRRDRRSRSARASRRWPSFTPCRSWSCRGRERFDAAILYDAMHHFDDEVGTLRAIRRTLVPGGRIFIHEGVRPSPRGRRASGS